MLAVSLFLFCSAQGWGGGGGGGLLTSLLMRLTCSVAFVLRAMTGHGEWGGGVTSILMRLTCSVASLCFVQGVGRAGCGEGGGGC